MFYHMIDQKLIFDHVPSLIDENIFYKKNQKKKNFVHDNYGKSPTLAGIMEPGC